MTTVGSGDSFKTTLYGNGPSSRQQQRNTEAAQVAGAISRGKRQQQGASSGRSQQQAR